MRPSRGCVLVLLGAMAVATADAQDARPRRGVGFAAGIGATYGNLIGGDFTGTKAAAGFDANVGVLLSRWQLGVGFDRTNHAHDDTDGGLIVSNIYVEPRLMFGSATRRLTPYAAVRVGRATASYKGVLGISEKATGYIAGVGAGVLWPIASVVGVDVAAHYARLSHDYGTGGYAEAEKGGRVSVRLGVRLGRTR